MKVLVVSPVPTHPPVAGNRARILSFVQVLQDMRHEVHLLYYPLEGWPGAAMSAFWGDRLHTVSKRRLPMRALKNLLTKLCWKAGLQSLLPRSFYNYTIDSWYTLKLHKKARQLQSEHHFGMVVAEYAFLSKVLEIFPEQVLRVIDLHDRLAGRKDIFLSQYKRPEWFSCTKEEEARGLRRADAVIAIQEEEADYFQSIADVPVFTIGHMARFNPLPLPQKRTVGFLASDNEVNRTTLSFIQGSLWPKVIAKCKDAELVIAGGICNAAQSGTQTRLLGRVADAAEAYGEMQVVINPVFSGTGLKIKSLEALTFGRPLVCTPHAAKGLAEGNVVYLAESAEEMAEKIIGLLHQPPSEAMLEASCGEMIGRYNAKQMEELNRLLCLKKG